jgi:hypothetical protein
MRIFVIALLSVSTAAVMHIVPVAYDAFDLVQFQGQQLKVFPRGWPLSYVFEGEFRDQPEMIAFKCILNVLSVFLALYLLSITWRKLQKRRLRFPTNQNVSSSS